MNNKTNNDIENLAECWGKNPILLDHPWIDTQSLPTAIPELESFLRLLPSEKLFVRLPGNAPGSGEPERTGLGAPGELERRLRDEPLHILGINLQDVSIAFQNFLDQFLERISPALDFNGITSTPEASVAIFLSSPNCVVPFHSDPEHNFLIQLNGNKDFHIFPNDDYTLFPSIYRETLVRTKQCVLPFEDSFQLQAQTLKLSPGSSTYQPPLAPHWVGSADNINISLAISVYTSAEERMRRLLTFNNRLRKLQITPLDIGRSKWSDNLKYVVASSLKKTKEVLKNQTQKSHFE